MLACMALRAFPACRLGMVDDPRGRELRLVEQVSYVQKGT